MVICFTALYLNYMAQDELCTVQHARFVLGTVVCTVAHSATAPCTFYHGSSRYCHGEKLVPIGFRGKCRRAVVIKVCQILPRT